MSDSGELHTPSEDEWAKIMNRVGTTPESVQRFDPDDIPDLEGIGGSVGDPKGNFVEFNVNILMAYRMWCAKMEPKVGKKTESIMISCPMPNHVDSNPSAWINTEKGLWYCGTCAVGGDSYDIAALHYGYDFSYRKAAFREVVDHMARDMGYTPAVANLRVVPEPSEDASDREAEGQVQPDAPGDDLAASSSDGTTPDVIEGPIEEIDGHVAQVIVHPSVSLPEEDDQGYSSGVEPFDWQKLYDANGFRAAYMEAVQPGRLIPTEFHAANADQVLSLAIGRNFFLQRGSNVYSNLFSVLLGPTGSGKSQSTRPAKELIRECMPFDDKLGTGVKALEKPGSGEALIDMMEFKGYDPALGFESFLPVRGFLHVDELAELVSRSMRSGSTLKSVIMEMYAGTESDVTTTSLSGGMRIARNPFLSIVTSTQPGVLGNLMDDTDLQSGYLNRFVFYSATRPVVPDDYDPVEGDPPYKLDVPKHVLTQIVNRFSVRTEALMIEDDAKDAFRQVFFSEQWDKRDFTDQPILARSELLFMKLCLLNAADVQSSDITMEHIILANEQLQYFKMSYGYTATKLEFNIYDEVMERLVRTIRRIQARDGKGASEGQVRQAFRKTRYLDVMDKVMKFAIDSGQVQAELTTSSRSGGRPTIRYTVGA
jgi:hypothetical protein